MTKTLFSLATVSTMLVLAGCQTTDSKQPLAKAPPPADSTAEVYVPPSDIPTTTSDTGIPTADYTMTNSGSSNTAATTYTPPAAPTTTYTAPAATGQQTHVVQRGDTLWSVSRRFYGNGNRWREIAQANGITNERRLIIGQTLIIP